MLSRGWLGSLFVMISLAAAAASTPALRPRSAAIAQREMQLSRALTREQEFVDVRHVSLQQSCEQINPPVALTTPDPLSVPAGHGRKVAVSFIIGTDGRVHSPLILESAGFSGDRRVLETVRTWRYRPATCNGVPTETEGKIEFSIR
jgi:TonB family protein